MAPTVVPVVPFAFLFAAIVQAQAPECYTRSGHFLGLAECLPPKPPELSVRHFYPPDMELNADILGIGRATHSKPHIPPYEVRRFVVVPQLCAPVRDAYGNLEQPERLPNGRCEDGWDGFPFQSDAVDSR
jgi:hypothetical protein